MIALRDVAEVAKKGTLIFPGNNGRITGKVVPRDRPKGAKNGFLTLSSGRMIPWTPADQIKW